MANAVSKDEYIDQLHHQRRILLQALKNVVASYDLSNRELIAAGILPDGKQPVWVLAARKAIEAVEGEGR